MSETLIERLRRTKTERLMRPAFGGIMLDMEDERQAPVNPDGPEAADYITDLEARLASSPEDVERVALQGVVAAWESLPGPRIYPVHEVQEWLVGPMADSINAARAALKQDNGHD